MSESAILDAMEDHAGDPVDPNGRMAKGCEESRSAAAEGKTGHEAWTGPDRCLAVFRCRRCWPFVR